MLWLLDVMSVFKMLSETLLLTKSIICVWSVDVYVSFPVSHGGGTFFSFINDILILDATPCLRSYGLVDATHVSST